MSLGFLGQTSKICLVVQNFDSVTIFLSKKKVLELTKVNKFFVSVGCREMPHTTSRIVVRVDCAAECC